MLHWLSSNLSTIVISLLLLAVIFDVVSKRGGKLIEKN